MELSVFTGCTWHPGRWSLDLCLMCTRPPVSVPWNELTCGFGLGHVPTRTRTGVHGSYHVPGPVQGPLCGDHLIRLQTHAPHLGRSSDVISSMKTPWPLPRAEPSAHGTAGPRLCLQSTHLLLRDQACSKAVCPGGGRPWAVPLGPFCSLAQRDINFQNTCTSA